MTVFSSRRIAVIRIQKCPTLTREYEHGRAFAAERRGLLVGDNLGWGEVGCYGGVCCAARRRRASTAWRPGEIEETLV
jgi:hypothetical protein